MNVSDAEWEALRRSLTTARPLPARQAAAAITPRRRALGLAVWSLAAAVGIWCAVIAVTQPHPAPHRARPAAACTLAVPCAPAHACPRNAAGHLACAYVLVRTARGLVRMPWHAARAYLRMRRYGGGMRWLGTALNAGGSG